MRALAISVVIILISTLNVQAQSPSKKWTASTGSAKIFDFGDRNARPVRICIDGGGDGNNTIIARGVGLGARSFLRPNSGCIDVIARSASASANGTLSGRRSTGPSDSPDSEPLLPDSIDVSSLNHKIGTWRFQGTNNNRRVELINLRRGSNEQGQDVEICAEGASTTVQFIVAGQSTVPIRNFSLNLAGGRTHCIQFPLVTRVQIFRIAEGKSTVNGTYRYCIESTRNCPLRPYGVSYPQVTYPDQSLN